MEIVSLDFPNCIFSSQTLRTELILHRIKQNGESIDRLLRTDLVLSIMRTSISALHFLVLIFSFAIDSKVVSPGLFFGSQSSYNCMSSKILVQPTNVSKEKKSRMSFLHYFWLFLFICYVMWLLLPENGHLSHVPRNDNVPHKIRAVTVV